MRVLLHEIELIAQDKGGAHRLAVIFLHREQPIDAVVAFRIGGQAGAHNACVIRLRGGENLDVVHDHAAAEAQPVRIDAQQQIRRHGRNHAGREHADELQKRRGHGRNAHVDARIDALRGAVKMHVHRARCGGRVRIDHRAQPHRIADARLDDGHAVGIEIGALGDHAFVVGDVIAGDLPRAAPDRAERPGARAAVDVVGSPSQRRPHARAAGHKSAIEAEILEIIDFVALAPPEKPRGVANHPGAFAQFDQAKKRIGQRPGQQSRIGKIERHRGRRGVRDNHLRAAFQPAGVIKRIAARRRERQHARHHVRVAERQRNAGQLHAVPARRGPGYRRRRLGEITLPRLKEDAHLMHAGRKLRRQRRRRASRTAAGIARRSELLIGERRRGRHRLHQESPVERRVHHARDQHGRAGIQIVGRGSGNRNDVVIAHRAGGRVGHRIYGLRRRVERGQGSRSGTHLAHAIEIRSVILPGNIDAEFSVVKGDVLAAKKRRRFCAAIRRDEFSARPGIDLRQRARRKLAPKRSGRIERQQGFARGSAECTFSGN